MAKALLNGQLVSVYKVATHALVGLVLALLAWHGNKVIDQVGELVVVVPVMKREMEMMNHRLQVMTEESRIRTPMIQEMIEALKAMKASP